MYSVQLNTCNWLQAIPLLYIVSSITLSPTVLSHARLCCCLIHCILQVLSNVWHFYHHDEYCHTHNMVLYAITAGWDFSRGQREHFAPPENGFAPSELSSMIKYLYTLALHLVNSLTQILHPLCLKISICPS